MSRIHCGETFLIAVPNGKPHPLDCGDGAGTGYQSLRDRERDDLRNNVDQTVTLVSGDYPFITHASTVFYADAKIVDARDPEAQLAANLIAQRAACSSRLLQLVKDGILTSPYTPKKVETFCRVQWGLPPAARRR